MKEFEIRIASDVYRFVDRLKEKSRKQGETNLLAQLDDALQLGSSSLEILGAIRLVIINNQKVIERLLGPHEKGMAYRVIAFVDKAFGR